MKTIKITAIGARFVVESQDGRINILNERSLKWNLKHMFGFTGEEVLTVMVLLGQESTGNERVVELEVA
jgi:hypothetical protein